MKKIYSIVSNLEYREPFIKSANIDLNEVTEGDRIFINWLFTQLKVICPAYSVAWNNQETYENAKKIWLRGFKISDKPQGELIQKGLDKLLLKYEKIPSNARFIPQFGEFLALCKLTEEELGLPSLDNAYKEACYNSSPTAIRKWSHEAVHHAWKETGSHELSTLPQQQSKPIFERNYEITCRRILEGKPLVNIPMAIENDIQKTSDVVLDEYKNISDAKSAFTAMMKKLKG